jgi:hypothetical protein
MDRQGSGRRLGVTIINPSTVGKSAANLPYLDPYREWLELARPSPHDTEKLRELSERLGYREEVATFLAPRAKRISPDRETLILK